MCVSLSLFLSLPPVVVAAGLLSAFFKALALGVRGTVRFGERRGERRERERGRERERRPLLEKRRERNRHKTLSEERDSPLFKKVISPGLGRKALAKQTCKKGSLAEQFCTWQVTFWGQGFWAHEVESDLN